MGRMADILRSAEREVAARPLAAAPTVNVADTSVDASDDDVPFIEVGAPPGRVLRLLPGPPPPRPAPPPMPASDDDEPEETNADGTQPPTPGLFTIRFQPVHAGRRPG